MRRKERRKMLILFVALILAMVAFGIGLLLLAKPFLKIYVSDSYYDAWRYTPFLIIGCVYLTLGTFMATSYTVHKDSFGYLFSGSFGAVFNILLNFILVPVIGVYGAALATCILQSLCFVCFTPENILSMIFGIRNLFWGHC